MEIEAQDLESQQAGSSNGDSDNREELQEPPNEHLLTDSTSTEIAIELSGHRDLHWRLIQLPSDNEEMVSFLRITKPGKDLQEAAGELLAVFLNGRRAVTTTSHWIAFLENSIHPEPRERLSKREAAVRVILHCYHSFSSTDWRLIQRLTCLVCTQSAAPTLALISRDASMLLSISRWSPHDCSCIAERWADLVSLKGRPAAVGAMQKLSIALHYYSAPAQEGHHCWAPATRTIGKLLKNGT